ncbi:2Fe-2S iron-sulfur cluster-binding protein [Sulfitobacter aestuariivivens]|uniref:2Fe-2S iron-sulfur cluster-binding protein n=1 Tax=Sulfitobacter aestuariivivens TaxID=2766981 RepID=UPI00361F41FA
MRAISGLYLLAYVTMHLLNLSLGLISIDAMDAARPYLSGVWTGPVTGNLLLLMLLIHYVLGLWATYCRPSLTGTSQDLVQALSGLFVIPLLAIHAVGVSMLKLSGVVVDYETLNRLFWLTNPGIGLVQVMLISVVWVHGCAGFFIALRARPGMVNVLPWLYPIAVAVPVIALLGYTQAGRIVLAEGLEPVYEQVPNLDGTLPDVVPYARIQQITFGVLWGSVALAALVLLARALRSWLARPGQVDIETLGIGRITVQTGQSMLDAFRAENQSHASLCSGRGRCGTCAVRVLSSDVDLPHQPIGAGHARPDNR